MQRGLLLVSLQGEGPTLGGVCWRFNAWGGTFSPCDKDQRVGRLVLEHSGVGNNHTYEAPFVLEGGSIHTDGEG